MTPAAALTRCPWCGTDPLYTAYHDHEWGVPVHDDRLLFEFLILEGAQAGLSWITILRKREAYREAFDHFDAEKVACYNDKKVAALLANSGIVRNRLKVSSAIDNARATLAVKASDGSLNNFLWQFSDSKPVQNNWQEMSQVPASTPTSEAMSRELKKRGFRFVGPTICYALMQATGMVNDHLVGCHRHQAVKALA